ncbi:hypothetical protein [Peptostreptococcus stomatis]|uniref:hypothetical protein n=1 Tax=Peptostreptococcus stomatis TaxID=341694 RepID=UPI0028D069B3|nr:hypothetical protein [Peptostreptococcus stomatis]
MQNTDSIIKKLYIKSYESDQAGYVDLSLPKNRLISIGLKILDNSFKGSLSYDLDRLYDELVYFNHYSQKGQACPLNFFLPMILANRSYDTYEASLVNLADKIQTYYSSLDRLDDYIIQVQAYDRLIRAYIRSGGQSIEGDKLIPILTDIKDDLVAYNFPKKTKKETINFQLKKLKYIGKIHRLIDSMEGISTYNVVKSTNKADKSISNIGISIDDIGMSTYNTGTHDLDIFDRIAYLQGGQVDGDSLTRVLAHILGYEIDKVGVDDGAFLDSRSSLEVGAKDFIDVKSGSEVDSKTFVASMADYLLDLRNRNKITRKYGARSSPKHFLNEDVGYQGQDPILNRYKILEKAKEGNSYRIRLATKSGLYDMIYNIKT